MKVSKSPFFSTVKFRLRRGNRFTSALANRLALGFNFERFTLTVRLPSCRSAARGVFRQSELLQLPGLRSKVLDERRFAQEDYFDSIRFNDNHSLVPAIQLDP